MLVSPFPIIWLLVSLFFLTHPASGQEVPHIRNFSPADYGGQNQNWALAQDTSAGSWIYSGNNGGLLEFDGVRWQTFFLPEKQTVRAVAVGLHGEIFCGGFAEFGYWHYDQQEQFIYTSLSRGVEFAQLGKEEIWHILVGPEFVLFQSFSVIYKFDYQKVSVLHPPGSIMFARAVAGQVILPVIGRGLYDLLPDGTFRFLAGTEKLANEIIQFVVPNGQRGLWIGTSGHGMLEWQDGQCNLWRHPLNTAFRQYQLNRAIALREGGWAIGTILNGVYILDAAGQLRYHLNRENGLQNNTVLALHEDRTGNLWMGLDRGIDLVALRSPLTFFSDQSGNLGTVYTAAQWRDKLYIGTNQGVFVRPVCTSAGTCDERFQLVNGTQGQVWQLQVFDQYLFCGHNSGTFLIEPNTVTKISEITGGWSAIPVPGRPDVLIQGTYTGLVVFHRSIRGQWQAGQRIVGFSEPLKKIAFDSLGYLWGAHPNKGLYRLHLNSDFTEVQEFRLFSRLDGLPSDAKLDLAIIQGRLIVNTGFLPLQLTYKDNQVIFRPVANAAIRQKWLPATAGDFFAVDSSGLRLYIADRQYPFMLNLVPAFENVVALDADNYLFCLENGFARLDQRNLITKRPVVAAMPAIRSVEIGDGVIIKTDNRTEVRLKSWQNSLKFKFSSPFFERMPQFSWFLEGYSSQWSTWQSSAEKEFASLSPGYYVFRLRTALDMETSLVLRIASPWYQSGWAWLLYTCLAAAFIWGIEVFSRRRLQQQRRNMEAEQARELAHQRTEVEKEKLRLEVENKSRELSNAAFNLIRKNEVLQRLKDDLMAAQNEPRAWQQIIRRIDDHLAGNHDWEIFEESFNRVHDEFFKRLKLQFSELTPGDLRLAAYLRMNLSSKEIAPLLNISVRGVENKRYRLRRKLDLPEEANLTEFIMTF